MAGSVLLSVQDAQVRYATKMIFDELTFHVSQGDKICLVGKNGAGKSTLMNVITGVRELDAGKRWQMPGATIGYLQQEIIYQSDQTIYDFVFAGLSDDNQDEMNAYKVDMVLTPLELVPSATMGTLSGGQLRRVALARALVEEPDILLLDEPTNHLDLDVIEWLEGFLRGYRGALVCISHDKTFLANVSDRVFWLDRGRLRVCPKGFGFFEEWQTQILEQEERELANRAKTVAMEVEWASRGVKARRKRNVRRVEMVREAREKLKQDQAAFRRLVSKIALEPLPEDQGTSKIVAECYGVSKTYRHGDRDKIILEKFNCRIMRGDRIGILGKNGSGKTTFIKLLLGEETPDMGKVKLARDLSVSYFDQKRRDLNPEHSLWKTLSPTGGEYIDVMGKNRHVCGYLKDFMFDPSMAHQPISTLSGGQKNRLMLARVLAHPGSLLVLDEPTNDLDMETLDRLEDILSHYTGTLLVVSHDRDFLDQTVTKILAFEGDGRVEGLVGGYQDYLADKKRREELTETKTQRADIAREEASPVGTASDAPKKLSYKLQFELEQLPARIAALEQHEGQLEDQLADPGLYARDPSGFQTLSRALQQVKLDLAAAEERWLELEALRAALPA